MTCTATRTRQPTMPRPLRFDEDPFGSLYNLPQEDEMFPVFPCDDILFPKSDAKNVDDIASIFESLADQVDQFRFETKKKHKDAENIYEIASIFNAMVDEASELHVEPKQLEKKKQYQCVITRQLKVSQDAENIDEIASIFDAMVDEATELYVEPKQTEKNSEAKSKEPEKKKKQLTPEQSVMARQLAISEAAMLRMLQTKTSAMVVEPPKKYIPVQTFLPPSAVAVDYRCFQPTAFAEGKIDPRIPSIVIPKMDASLRPPELRILSTKQEHDEKTCDICQSNKTPQRKAILHRWRIRRQRRNWSKGPRYGGRSSVASNRTRVNGRFVPTARWV